MEHYKAIPISNTKVLRDDGSVDTLDNVIKQQEERNVYRARPNNMNNDTSGKGGDHMKTNQEKIEELKALKAEVEYARSVYEGDGEGADHSTMGNSQARQRTNSLSEDELRDLYEEDSQSYSPTYSQSEYQQAIDAYEKDEDQEQTQQYGEEQAKTLVLRRSR